MNDHTVRDAVTSGAVSVAGASTSFFVDTLPIVQWGAAAIAIVAGGITIALGVIKLMDWSRRA